ncbi:MAG: hypothetical protein K8S99_02205 [Planctomycetes bacterium]|nr:hypothetical protein [Planctomycetota bacterium]
MSRRYLRILNAWAPTGREYFSDWDVRPNCGHFLGGVHWYGAETVAGVLTFALLSTSPKYDERLGGCSREELVSMAVKGLRYLCFTHDTGPAECVRPAKGLGRPENQGTKWGERGKGFFMESQCGQTVAGMAISALLLGDRVDDETRAMLGAIHRDYAERFGTMSPKHGVYFDTQTEENAWTSFGLASVECLLEKAPDAAKWAETARLWMFRTATAPQDARNRGVFDGGKTVTQLTSNAFTTLPDYMAENHGMVHPSYGACALYFLGNLGLTYGVFGKKVPPHALFNRREIYERLKRITDGAGYLHPVQGMDWPYHVFAHDMFSHAAAALLLDDPDACALEALCLGTLEHRLRGNGGRMNPRELTDLCHDIQDPMIIRECEVTSPAYAYLLHRLYGDGPPPTPMHTLEKKLAGVKVFPHSGFIHQRHPRGMTSVAWRNCVMALPLTREGILTAAPATDSVLASFTIRDRPDSQDLLHVSTDTHADGFAVGFSVLRAQGSVRQDVLFAGLPNGVSLLHESLTAREDVVVENVEQGLLRITNEKFVGMGTQCRGARVLYTPDGSEEFRGFVSADPASDVIRAIEHPAWLNVDDRLGLVFAGSGKTVYHNRHHFKTWWATADDLTLNRIEGPVAVKKDRPISVFRALMAPEVGARETPRLSLVPLACRVGLAAGLIGEGFFAAANFADKAREILFSVPRARLAEIPVYPGTLRVTTASIEYPLALAPGQAVLRYPLMAITISGSVRVVASETGGVLVENTGTTSAAVGTGKKVFARKIKPGAIVRIA